ncbi:MAG: ATP-binding protein, partial [Defluviitaleaceae bacterium]|nr:ATP-binding protein [Defluviitaleaceae bacterium]
KEYINNAYIFGYQRFEWMRCTLEGEPVPVEMTLVPVEHKHGRLVAGYCRDIRDHKNMMIEIEKKDRLLNVTNRLAEVLLAASNEDTFDETLIRGMELIGQCLEADCVQVWPNEMINGQLHFVLLYKWLSEDGKKAPNIPIGTPVPYSGRWIHQFMKGEYVNGPVAELPQEDRELLTPFGLTSTITIPLYYREQFWGVFCVGDCVKKRYFSENEINLLNSTGLMIVNAINRNTQAAQTRYQLAKLNLVVKATKIALWDMELDKDATLTNENKVVYSDEFRTMLGFSGKKDFPNVLKSWSSLLHPDESENVIAAFTGHINDRTGMTPFDTEFRMIKKDGGIAYFHATGETIRDKEGCAVRVVGALMDITETKKLLLDLETEKSLLQTMFDSVPDLIFCKDLNFNYTRCNKSLLKYFGINEDELIGKDDESGLGIPSKAARESREMDIAVISEKKVFTYEELVPSHDGQLRLFETNKVPLLLNDRILGIMGTARDITERKAMEEAAQSANKAKSSFLAIMSHEIRTPMNAILGITEIQLQNENLDQDLREGLEKIYISGDMLLGIINDILDLSKIEAGKLELVSSRYETASLVSDTAQLNMMRIGSKPIEFELEIDEDIPADFIGDELRVKQILNNILSNAFKYTSAGKVVMKISVKDAADDDIVILSVSVSDTGQGMTKEQVDKLFDEYSRFNHEANRSTEGTGLGMSITRNLIQMMNGEIEIASEPGKGSTFTVNLPQGKVDSGKLGREMADNLHKFRTSSRAQMKRMQITRDPMPYGSVLIVDDVETNIFVAKGLLVPYELSIDSADSGFAAIAKIAGGKVYDIIFIDHMMPKMDGIETTKKIRETGYNKPIVALTANAVAGQAEIFLGNGFDDFISKPIDIRQMNAVLNKHIRDVYQHEALTKTSGKTEKQKADQARTATDKKFAEVFLRDANKTIVFLREFTAKGPPYSDEDMRMYIIKTHGIKSALASIGRLDLSSAAFKLEQLGRDNSTGFIANETPPFLNSLQELVDGLEQKSGGECESLSEEAKAVLAEKLNAIAKSCENFDETAADDVLNGLIKMSWPSNIKELLNDISEKMLHSDFEEIIETVRVFAANK